MFSLSFELVTAPYVEKCVSTPVEKCVGHSLKLLDIV